MTELSFLLDLLLNHKLPLATKKAVTERVREVEARLSAAMPITYTTKVMSPLASSNIPSHLVGQSPSTIAAMMRNGMANEMPANTTTAVSTVELAPPPPAPVAVVAQTPAAAAALNARNDAILQGLSGKPEKGRTSPRKF